MSAPDRPVPRRSTSSRSRRAETGRHSCSRAARSAVVEKPGPPSIESDGRDGRPRRAACGGSARSRCGSCGRAGSGGRAAPARTRTRRSAASAGRPPARSPAGRRGGRARRPERSACTRVYGFPRQDSLPDRDGRAPVRLRDHLRHRPHVCVSGALGGVGRALVRGVVAADGYRLHSAVARREVGRDVGEVVMGRPSALRSRTTWRRALDRRPDVLIDYTHPSVIRRHVDLALARPMPVVIGTTGLTDADFERIDAAARSAGVGVATGNFSVTAALMQHLARFAARHVADWEIVEYGPATKPDCAQRNRARAGRAARPRARRGAARRPPPSRSGRPRPAGPRSAARGCTRSGCPGSSPAVEVVFGAAGRAADHPPRRAGRPRDLRRGLAARGRPDTGPARARPRARHPPLRPDLRAFVGLAPHPSGR